MFQSLPCWCPRVRKCMLLLSFKLPLKDGSPASTCSSSPKLDWMIKKGMVGAKCILFWKRVNRYCHLCFFYFLWHQFAFVEFEIAVVGGFNLLFLCWWWKKMLHCNFIFCSPTPYKPHLPPPLFGGRVHDSVWEGVHFFQPCLGRCYMSK